MRDLLSGAGMLAYARTMAYDVPSTAAIFAHPDRYGTLVAQAHEAFEHLIDIVALAYEPASILVVGGYSESFTSDDFDRVRVRVRSRLGVSSTLERPQLGGDAGLLGAMAHALGTLHVNLGATDARQTRIGPDREGVLERFRALTPELVRVGV